MIDELAVLGYIASIYPVGTRFAAYLIARQKRHQNKHSDSYYHRDSIYDSDRAISIVLGYVYAVAWPITVPAWVIATKSVPSIRRLREMASDNIDKHVEKIEGRGQRETLGKLGTRDHV